MDFIEDDQAILMLRQVEFRLRQLGAIGWQLQIEVERLFSHFLGQRKGESRLAHLSRAKQGHGWKLL